MGPMELQNLSSLVSTLARFYILFLIGGLILYYWKHQAERRYVLYYIVGSSFYTAYTIWRTVERQPEPFWVTLGTVGAATLYHALAAHNIRLYGQARGARAVARSVKLYDTHGVNKND